MMVAAGGDGEPDVADRAGAFGEENLLGTAGGNVPGVAVAASAVVARLFERAVMLRPA